MLFQLVLKKIVQKRTVFGFTESWSRDQEMQKAYTLLLVVLLITFLYFTIHTQYQITFRADTKSYPVECGHLSAMWLSTFLTRSARRSFCPLQKSRQNHRSYVWTEALSGVVFVRA